MKIFAIIIVTGIFITNHLIFRSPIKPTIILDSLNELQKASHDTLTEMSKLLISLATALFGLLGFFALENYKANGLKIDQKYLTDLVLAFLAAALSIDYGYVFMEKWVEELSMGVFNPYDKVVLIPQNLQLFTFLIAFFFSGRFTYKILQNK